MPKGRLGAEQNVTKLRQIEVLQGQGKSVSLGCKEAETTEQTYYRWHREYGGLNVAQPKRLKQLEDENGRLMKLVADLSLEKQVLIARPRRSQSRCPCSTEPELCNSLSLRLVQKIGQASAIGP